MGSQERLRLRCSGSRLRPYRNGCATEARPLVTNESGEKEPADEEQTVIDLLGDSEDERVEEPCEEHCEEPCEEPFERTRQNPANF